MSIHQQVEDARFLAQAGRHIGALTILMLAVAASAAKCFPKGTKSQEEPADPMGDREAFTLFLGGRIRKVLFGNSGGPDYGSSGIGVGFRGKTHDLAYILYKFYRCELVHEGELPVDVEFVPKQETATSPTNTGNSGFSVSISNADKLVLDSGWIDLLIAAVVQARCNAAEFGIQHFDLLAKPHLDAAAFEQATVAKYGISPGRFRMLKDAIFRITPHAIEASDDSQLSARFAELVHSGQVHGGALESRGLINEGGGLQPKGIAVLREIASAYVRIEV